MTSNPITMRPIGTVVNARTEPIDDRSPLIPVIFGLERRYSSRPRGGHAMTTIATVSGETTSEKLGKTLMHEHLVIGFPGWESDTVRPGPGREEAFATGDCPRPRKKSSPPRWTRPFAKRLRRST